MLLVAAAVRMLLGMRLRPLSLLRRTRFRPRLLRLLRAGFLARCWLWTRFLTRRLLGLLRMIFLTRLRLRLRARFLARSLLSHRRVKFRGACLLRFLWMILCGARLLLRLGLRTDRRCARFPFGLFRRASSRRRIFGRMRHTALLLALLRGDGARLLPVLRFALRRERLTTGLLLRRAVHLRLLCLLRHRRMRLGPRGFVTTLGGGLLSRYRTACAVLPEAVRIGTGSLRRTRHAVVRLRTFIGHLTRSAWRTRRTRSAGPSLLGRAVRRLSAVR